MAPTTKDLMHYRAALQSRLRGSIQDPDTFFTSTIRHLPLEVEPASWTPEEFEHYLTEWATVKGYLTLNVAIDREFRWSDLFCDLYPLDRLVDMAIHPDDPMDPDYEHTVFPSDAPPPVWQGGGLLTEDDLPFDDDGDTDDDDEPFSLI